MPALYLGVVGVNVAGGGSVGMGQPVFARGGAAAAAL